MLFLSNNKSIEEMIIKELNDKYCDVVVFTDKMNGSDIDKCMDLILIDLAESSENGTGSLNSNQKDILNEAKKYEVPVLLFNVNNKDYLKDIIGIGIKSDWVLIKPYEFYNVMDIAGEIAVPEYESKSLVEFAGEKMEFDTSNDIKFKDEVCIKDYVECIAKQINEGIKDEFVSPADVNNFPSLPAKQYSLNYIRMVQDFGLTNVQLAHAEIVMEVALIASYSPSWKYLRIRSLGAGLHPASGKNIDSDGKYARGAFQSTLELTMQPKSSQLITLSSEPKNINNVTQYTTSSSFTVGVDIAKEPSFSPSYTVTDSETRNIADFNIYNDSSGSTGKWKFIMSMIENSIWDAFRHPFLSRPRVKELPILAKKNLQPVVETVWYIDNNFNGTVPVDLSWFIQYYFCDVNSSWTPHYWTHRYNKTLTVNVNFGTVNF